MAKGHDEVVFLLPGFLGFDKLNDFQYFVDRAGATLRTALWARTGIDVPVIPLATLPTASLGQRQQFLQRRIGQYLGDDLLRGCRKVHLVGHSTGGVDAWLLLCGKPLATGQARREAAAFSGSWGAFAGIADRIGSVVAISAPFYGAAITRSPALQLIGDFPEGLWQNRRGFQVLGQGLAALGRHACLRNTGPFDLAINALIDTRATGKMAQDVLGDRRLVDDLLPERMAETMHQAPFPRDRTVTCFASVAPRPRMPGHHHRCRESLYRVCYDEIRRAGEQGFATQVLRNLERLNGETGEIPGVIGDPMETPGPLAITDNDGIVNTGAMIPAKGGVLAAVVHGDHADVIGHYDRDRDDRHPMGHKVKADTGLLDSGSGFEDDAFFQLYRAVADVIRPGPGATVASSPAKRGAPRPR